MVNHFDEIVAQLGKTLGMEDLALDDGFLGLAFDDVPFYIELSGKLVMIYTQLADAPAGGNLELYTELLHANYLCKDTKGAAIGLNDENGIFLFYQVNEDSLTYPIFEESLTNFVNVAEYWRMKIADILAGNALKTSASDNNADGQMFNSQSQFVIRG